MHTVSTSLVLAHEKRVPLTFPRAYFFFFFPPSFLSFFSFLGLSSCLPCGLFLADQAANCSNSSLKTGSIFARCGTNSALVRGLIASRCLRRSDKIFRQTASIAPAV